MWRFATWLLVACFVPMSTGALQALHRWQHAMEEAHHACPAGHADHAPEHSHGKDHGLPGDSDCPLCVLMHQPLQRAIIAPALVALARIDVLPHIALVERVPDASPLRVDCRGPPVTPVVFD